MKIKRSSRREKNGHFVVPHIHMHINYCIHNRYIYCNIATYQECALARSQNKKKKEKYKKDNTNFIESTFEHVKQFWYLRHTMKYNFWNCFFYICMFLCMYLYWIVFELSFTYTYFVLSVLCIGYLYLCIHLSSTKPLGCVLRRAACQLVGSVSRWRAILKDKSEKPQIFPREYTLTWSNLGQFLALEFSFRNITDNQLRRIHETVKNEERFVVELKVCEAGNLDSR